MTRQQEDMPSRVVRYGLCCTGFFIALGLYFYSSDSIQIKTLFLHIGVLVVTAAFLIGRIRQKAFAVRRLTMPMLALSFLFMLSALFSYAFVSPSKDTSIEELLQRIPYFAVFAITAVVLDDFSRIASGLRCVLVTAAVVSVYGVLQHLKLEPAFLAEMHHERICSTFGNANFYTGFLLLAVFTAIAGFDFSQAKNLRQQFVCFAVPLVAATIYYIALIAVPLGTVSRIAGLVALLSLSIAGCLLVKAKRQLPTVVLFAILVLNLLCTSSRSGQIGLAVGIVVYGVVIITLVIKGRWWKKNVAFFGVAAVVVGLMLTGVRHFSYERTNSVKERQFYAMGTIDLIKKHPFLGNGIGTFKINYPRVRDISSWAYAEVCYEYPRDPYNEILELWHDEGIVGLLLFLSLVVLIWFFALRRLTTSPDTLDENSGIQDGSWLIRMFVLTHKNVTIGLCAGTIALLASNIFSLSMRYVSTGYFFWYCMGMLAALGAASSATRVVFSGKTIIPNSGRPTAETAQGLIARILQIVCIVALGACAWYTWNIFMADVHFTDAVAHSRNAYRQTSDSASVYHDVYVEGTAYRSDALEWEAAIRMYRKSLHENGTNLRCRYYLGNAFNRRFDLRPQCLQTWGDTAGKPRNDAERALAIYRYIYTQAPHYCEIDFELGNLYSRVGQLDTAIYFYNLYKKYKPFFTKIHYVLAQCYVRKHDWLSAEKSYKDVLDFNAVFTIAYAELGMVYAFEGKKDLSEESYQKVRELSPTRADLFMANAYQDIGEWATALICLQKYLATNPGDVRNTFLAGWLSDKTNNPAKAIRYYKKTVELQPDHVVAWVNLSNNYYEQNKLDSAKIAMDQAMKFNPEMVEKIITSKIRTE